MIPRDLIRVNIVEVMIKRVKIVRFLPSTLLFNTRRYITMYKWLGTYNYGTVSLRDMYRYIGHPQLQVHMLLQ